MTSDSPRPSTDCQRFDALLGPWLEHDLEPADQAFMTRHRASCITCSAMADELDGIVREAAALPTVRPTRDLWAGIEARLETEVVPLTGATAATAAAAPPIRRAERTYSVRRLAIAAAALVSVTAGVTWQLANRASTATGDAAARVAAAAAVAAPDAAPRAGALAAAEPTALTTRATDSASNSAAKGAAVARTTDVVVTSPAAAAMARTVSRTDRGTSPATLDGTYEREIGTLRRIVDERFAELDSATVTELRRNLAIIDQAIADSRRALAKDPRSAFVSSQLDRALQAKLELMRRVALL